MGGTPSGTKTSFATSVAITYVGTANENTNVATKSFGNFSVASNGCMVVLYYGRGSSNITPNSVSIGGVDGNIWTAGASDNTNFAGAFRSVSAGAINVTVSLNQVPKSTHAHTVQVYHVTGANYNAPFWSDSIPVDGGANLSTNTRSLVYPNTRDAVYLFMAAHATHNENTVWSGATEDADTAVNTSCNVACAHKAGTSTLLCVEGTTETASWTTAAGGATLVGCGFK